MSKPKRNTDPQIARSQKWNTNADDPTFRGILAIIVIGLIVFISILASFREAALPVLEKVLPLATLIVGFFFGRGGKI
jgi:hypothetical protein